MLRVATGLVRMPDTDWEALDRQQSEAAYANLNGSRVSHIKQFACAMTYGSLDIMHSVEKISQTGEAYFCAYSSTHRIVLLEFALSPNPAEGVEKLRNTFDLEKAEVEDALGGDIMFMAFRPEKARQAVFILPTQDDALQSSGVAKLELQVLRSLFHLADLTLNNLSREGQAV